MDNEQNKSKVLIVDDEPTLRQLVRRLLAKEYEVVEAQNGSDALRVASDARPDIILMDMMMPTMDGLTACIELKKREATRSIPVVMVTAIGYEQNKKIAESIARVDGYLTKPFSPMELMSTVSRILAHVNAATAGNGLAPDPVSVK